MFIEPNPFPYLKQEQFAGRGNGEIIFLDKTIPDADKEWLRREYKKWWDNRKEKRFAEGIG